MKHLPGIAAMLVTLTLFACGRAPLDDPNPAESVVSSPSGGETAEEGSVGDTLIKDSTALIGTWSGSTGAGWMMMREDGTFRGAVRKEELVNSRPGDTTYFKGTYRFENGQLTFAERSIRCTRDDEGVYRAYRTEDGSVQFELVEDECETRANTLVGYRGEPAINILWEKISADAPHSVDWYRTIELPFIPHDIDVDASGNIYAIELGAPMIHKLDRDGNPVISWGGEGDEAGEFSFAPPPDGPPLDGGFVVVGEAGRVYVSDSYNNRVQIFDEQGEFVDMWEGHGPEGAPFDTPGPISVDESGNIYVADFSGVHQFEAQGNYIQTIPAAGEVALNSQGDLFSVIAFEHMALKMPAGGGDPLTWGGEGTGEGQFITPMWVVVRPDDSVYISDHSGRVQRFDSGGDFMALWAGPEDGDGPFTAPASLSSDANGNLYVAPKDRPMVYLLSQ